MEKDRPQAPEITSGNVREAVDAEEPQTGMQAAAETVGSMAMGHIPIPKMERGKPAKPSRPLGDFDVTGGPLNLP